MSYLASGNVEKEAKATTAYLSEQVSRSELAARRNDQEATERRASCPTGGKGGRTGGRLLEVENEKKKKKSIIEGSAAVRVQMGRGKSGLSKFPQTWKEENGSIGKYLIRG